MGEEACALLGDLKLIDVSSLVTQDSVVEGFVIGSETDEDMTPRKEKTRVHSGKFIDLKSIGVGVSCIKGKKPTALNQDSWFLVRYEFFSMYGVLDGHGPEGHHISHFVKQNLPKLILRDKRFGAGIYEMRALLRDSFHTMQAVLRQAHHLHEFDATLSGTTVTIAIHDFKNNCIWVVWLGDSQACIGALEHPKTNNLHYRTCNWEHKPELAGETERITACGGEVKKDCKTPSLRVHIKGSRLPALNISRCLGSLLGHDYAGLSADPAILRHRIANDDQVLLLCTDGVWQVIAVDFALKQVKGITKENCDQKVSKLLDTAWKEWTKDTCGFIDDITILLVKIN